MVSTSDQPYISELEGEWQVPPVNNVHKFIYKDGIWTEFVIQTGKYFPVKVSWDDKCEGWRVQRFDSVAYLSRDGDKLRFVGAHATHKCYGTWKKL